MPITRNSIVGFALRRPDIESVSLYSRTSGDTFASSVAWNCYRDHAITAMGGLGGDELGPVTTATFSFVIESQTTNPVPGDKFTDSSSVTWQIPLDSDVNVLGSIVKCTAVRNA